MQSCRCTLGRFATALGLGLLSLLLIPATAATQAPITGSYWYVIDHITSVTADAEVTLWLALPPDNQPKRKNRFHQDLFLKKSFNKNSCRAYIFSASLGKVSS